MIGRAGATALKAACVCACAALGFVLLQEPVRALEAGASIAILHAFGADSVLAVANTTVLVAPRQGAAFDVLITPSCSSLASILALGCLSPLTPWRPLARRIAATGTATGLIAAGNVLRIAGSIAVGIVAGRSSLVLFHDWVGSMFTFVYTMGGYIVMLALLLPRSAGPYVRANGLVPHAV